MGVISKILRFLRWRVKHEVQTLHIEERAEKVISRQKPIPAPRHPTDEESLKKLNEYLEKSETGKTLHEKSIELEERLKDVYVTSDGQMPEIKSTSSRPLPQSRVHQRFEFGFYEPTSVPTGKCTLREVITFLNDHKKDPEKYTAAVIAAKYNLAENTVQNILTYYALYTLRVPKEQKDEFDKIGVKLTESTEKVIGFFGPIESKPPPDPMDLKRKRKASEKARASEETKELEESDETKSEKPKALDKGHSVDKK